nr:hypothetical protein [Bacillota bacterium]
MVAWWYSKANKIWLRVLALVVSSVFFFTQIVGASVPDRNFWAERRRARQKLLASREKVHQSNRRKGLREKLEQKDVAGEVSSLITPQNLFTVPSEYGTVKEIHTQASSKKPQGMGNRLIIHIQDAHSSPEAQLNSANILKYLQKGVARESTLPLLICVEGSSGLVDTTLLSTFPENKIKEKVASEFLKEGKITGEEYFAIVKNDKAPAVNIYGVENKRAYDKNLKAFDEGLSSGERLRNYFRKVRKEINPLKARLYNKRLKGLESKIEAYQKKRIPLTQYSQYLHHFLDDSPLPSGERVRVRGKYPNFKLFVEASRYEKKIDFSRVDSERSKYIKELSKKLTNDELSDLLVMSLDYRLGKVTSAEYYTYLQSLSSRMGKGIRSQDPRILTELVTSKEGKNEYPNLNLYIKYNKLYDKIDQNKLFSEISELEQELKERLCEREEERKLVKLSRMLGVLKDLTSFKISNDDLSYYHKHRDEITSGMFSNFITTHNTPSPFPLPQGERIKVGEARRGLPKESGNVGATLRGRPKRGTAQSPSPTLVKANLSKFEGFYRIALNRNKSLVDNTISRMEKEGVKVAVLIAGGFHTPGITELLRDRNMSYVVVTPRLGENYSSDLEPSPRKRRSNLEKAIAGIVGAIRAASIFRDSSFQRYAVICLGANLTVILSSQFKPEEIERASQQLISDWKEELRARGKSTEVIDSVEFLSVVLTRENEAFALGVVRIKNENLPFVFRYDVEGERVLEIISGDGCRDFFLSGAFDNIVEVEVALTVWDKLPKLWPPSVLTEPEIRTTIFGKGESKIESEVEDTAHETVEAIGGLKQEGIMEIQESVPSSSFAFIPFVFLRGFFDRGSQISHNIIEEIPEQISSLASHLPSGGLPLDTILPEKSELTRQLANLSLHHFISILIAGLVIFGTIIYFAIQRKGKIVEFKGAKVNLKGLVDRSIEKVKSSLAKSRTRRIMDGIKMHLSSLKARLTSDQPLFGFKKEPSPPKLAILMFEEYLHSGEIKKVLEEAHKDVKLLLTELAKDLEKAKIVMDKESYNKVREIQKRMNGYMDEANEIQRKSAIIYADVRKEYGYLDCDRNQVSNEHYRDWVRFKEIKSKDTSIRDRWLQLMYYHNTMIGSPADILGRVLIQREIVYNIAPAIAYRGQKLISYLEEKDWKVTLADLTKDYYFMLDNIKFMKDILSRVKFLFPYLDDEDVEVIERLKNKVEENTEEFDKVWKRYPLSPQIGTELDKKSYIQKEEKRDLALLSLRTLENVSFELRGGELYFVLSPSLKDKDKEDIHTKEYIRLMLEVSKHEMETQLRRFKNTKDEGVDVDITIREGDELIEEQLEKLLVTLRSIGEPDTHEFVKVRKTQRAEEEITGELPAIVREARNKLKRDFWYGGIIDNLRVRMWRNLRSLGRSRNKDIDLDENVIGNKTAATKSMFHEFRHTLLKIAREKGLLTLEETAAAYRFAEEVWIVRGELEYLLSDKFTNRQRRSYLNYLKDSPNINDAAFQNLYKRYSTLRSQNASPEQLTLAVATHVKKVLKRDLKYDYDEELDKFLTSLDLRNPMKRGFLVERVEELEFKFTEAMLKLNDVIVKKDKPAAKAEKVKPVSFLQMGKTIKEQRKITDRLEGAVRDLHESEIQTMIMELKYNLRAFDGKTTPQEVINAVSPALNKTHLGKRIEKQLRNAHEKEEMLNALLPIIYACARKLAAKTLKGKRHYLVQLDGAVALHYGLIVDQQTGEGKSQTASLPAMLNALVRKVHIHTHSHKKAVDDAKELMPLYMAMGYSVGVCGEKEGEYYAVVFGKGREPVLVGISRREFYQRDIVYAKHSNNEFDYSRDRIKNDAFLQDLPDIADTFTLADEVDSLHIHEARTPHITTKPGKLGKKDIERIHLTDAIVREILKNKELYEADKHRLTASFTEEESNQKKIEYIIQKHLRRKVNIFKARTNEQQLWLSLLLNALQAHTLYEQGTDYLVEKDGTVALLSKKFTGRVMVGQRLSGGLHQAIEAKEGVTINPGNEDIDYSITTMRSFNTFNRKWAGFSGTAKAHKKPFNRVYGKQIYVVDTNIERQREDFEDRVSKNTFDKLRAIIEDIALIRQNPQEQERPILIGGIFSDKKAEAFGDILNNRGENEKIATLWNIDPNEVQTLKDLSSKLLGKIVVPVLNASHAEKEQEIIDRAGQRNAMTIATNIAGRETDIKTPKDVIEIGGLHVIGVTRSESKAVDLQLAGRAGRIGQKGSSRFYLSMYDDMYVKFWGEDAEKEQARLCRLLDKGKEDQVRLALDKIQKRVDERNQNEFIEQAEFEHIPDQQLTAIDKLKQGILEGKKNNRVDLYAVEYDFDRVIEMLVAKVKEIHSRMLTDKDKAVFEEKAEFISRQLLLRSINKHRGNYSKEARLIRQQIDTTIPGDNKQKLLAYQAEMAQAFNALLQTIYKESFTNIYRKNEIKNILNEYEQHKARRKIIAESIKNVASEVKNQMHNIINIEILIDKLHKNVSRVLSRNFNLRKNELRERIPRLARGILHNKTLSARYISSRGALIQNFADVLVKDIESLKAQLDNNLNYTLSLLANNEMLDSFLGIENGNLIINKASLVKQVLSGEIGKITFNESTAQQVADSVISKGDFIDQFPLEMGLTDKSLSAAVYDLNMGLERGKNPRVLVLKINKGITTVLSKVDKKLFEKIGHVLEDVLGTVVIIDNGVPLEKAGEVIKQIQKLSKKIGATPASIRQISKDGTSTISVQLRKSFVQKVIDIILSMLSSVGRFLKNRSTRGRLYTKKFGWNLRDSAVGVFTDKKARYAAGILVGLYGTPVAAKTVIQHLEMKKQERINEAIVSYENIAEKNREQFSNFQEEFESGKIGFVQYLNKHMDAFIQTRTEYEALKERAPPDSQIHQEIENALTTINEQIDFCRKIVDKIEHPDFIGTEDSLTTPTLEEEISPPTIEDSKQEVSPVRKEKEPLPEPSTTEPAKTRPAEDKTEKQVKVKERVEAQRKVGKATVPDDIVKAGEKKEAAQKPAEAVGKELEVFEDKTGRVEKEERKEPLAKVPKAQAAGKITLFLVDHDSPADFQRVQPEIEAAIEGALKAGKNIHFFAESADVQSEFVFTSLIYENLKPGKSTVLRNIFGDLYIGPIPESFFEMTAQKGIMGFRSLESMERNLRSAKKEKRIDERWEKDYNHAMTIISQLKKVRRLFFQLVRAPDTIKVPATKRAAALQEIRGIFERYQGQIDRSYEQGGLPNAPLTFRMSASLDRGFFAQQEEFLRQGRFSNLLGKRIFVHRERIADPEHLCQYIIAGDRFDSLFNVTNALSSTPPAGVETAQSLFFGTPKGPFNRRLGQVKERYYQIGRHFRKNVVEKRDANLSATVVDAVGADTDVAIIIRGAAHVGLADLMRSRVASDGLLTAKNMLKQQARKMFKIDIDIDEKDLEEMRKKKPNTATEQKVERLIILSLMAELLRPARLDYNERVLEEMEKIENTTPADIREEKLDKFLYLDNRFSLWRSMMSLIVEDDIPEVLKRNPEKGREFLKQAYEIYDAYQAVRGRTLPKRETDAKAKVGLIDKAGMLYATYIAYNKFGLSPRFLDREPRKDIPPNMPYIPFNTKAYLWRFLNEAIAKEASVENGELFIKQFEEAVKKITGHKISQLKPEKEERETEGPRQETEQAPLVKEVSAERASEEELLDRLREVLSHTRYKRWADVNARVSIVRRIEQVNRGERDSVKLGFHSKGEYRRTVEALKKLEEIGFIRLRSTEIPEGQPVDGILKAIFAGYKLEVLPPAEVALSGKSLLSEPESAKAVVVGREETAESTAAEAKEVKYYFTKPRDLLALGIYNRFIPALPEEKAKVLEEILKEWKESADPAKNLDVLIVEKLNEMAKKSDGLRVWATGGWETYRIWFVALGLEFPIVDKTRPVREVQGEGKNILAQVEHVNRINNFRSLIERVLDGYRGQRMAVERQKREVESWQAILIKATSRRDNQVEDRVKQVESELFKAQVDLAKAEKEKALAKNELGRLLEISPQDGFELSEELLEITTAKIEEELK